jgi:hypothetical protein
MQSVLRVVVLVVVQQEQVVAVVLVVFLTVGLMQLILAL